MSRAVPRFKRISPSLPAIGTTNGCVLYRIWGKHNAQLTITTFYYVAAVPAPTPAQLSTLLTNISTAIFASYKACVSADWSCTKETLDVVHRNDLQGVASTANAGAVGGRTAGSYPTEVSQPVIRYSAVKGQHGRGRLSLPAIAINDASGDKITAPVEITAIGTLGTQMKLVESDGTNNWTPSITQRATTPPKLVVGFSAITSVVMSALLGTIRRRKEGRGK